ncbi:hypothetical protein [Streptomyces sp. AN091965]|uniref:hypothetical protein n=1 Tax=Streptomyces sp. AN091965 TaxID=2927803 RepID=UPI001F61789A|nr:hypothetical protein [Streptomyces sp. AN091965]MCI3932702.1 hypothetical protein [Streptomyces sp. AN091965]
MRIPGNLDPAEDSKALVPGGGIRLPNHESRDGTRLRAVTFEGAVLARRPPRRDSTPAPLSLIVSD